MELAVLLPFLAFIFLVGVDYARLFYHYVIVTNCARNGALYASDAVARCQSPYGPNNLQGAALADASNLSPQPTVTSATGTDSFGPYAEVTVVYRFQTISRYPGIPSTVNLASTVRMRISPATVVGNVCP